MCMHVHGESPRGSSLIPVKSWILTLVCRQYAAQYNRVVVCIKKCVKNIARSRNQIMGRSPTRLGATVLLGQ